MGALPKRKPSTHRQGRRRASQKLSLPDLTICPHCGEEKAPHLVCPVCGEWGKPKNESKPKNRSSASGKKKSR
ncbi:50S ribosomal protein L32 [Candidatus Shapirobacteria bacterium]|nr:50S ribosomal protein L32 [Candidatus Shapirobacteria bacterium]